MIALMFSPARIVAVVILIAITAWFLGSLNATPRGTDRVRQSRPFPTLPVNR